MKSLGFFVEMDTFWLKMHVFLFRIMAAIFEGEPFKELQHFYQVIFPSLNECDFCNKKYYFRRTTSNCRTIEYETCKKIKPAKSSFIKKCTKEQVKYLEHFLGIFLVFQNLVVIFLTIWFPFLIELETGIGTICFIFRSDVLQKLLSFRSV